MRASAMLALCNAVSKAADAVALANTAKKLLGITTAAATEKGAEGGGGAGGTSADEGMATAPPKMVKGHSSRQAVRGRRVAAMPDRHA